MIKEPRDYQCEAISAVLEGFELNDRGQLILPCGAGKTLVALWIARSQCALKTLVLLPSLSLLKQIKDEWVSQGHDIPRLCVCSEQDIDDRTSEYKSLSDIDISVTTDPNVINNFIKSNPRHLIIYSTYQSLKKISDGMPDGFSFDLAICDEAHRTAGKKMKLSGTSLIHSDEHIRCEKRLYMTATPKIYPDSKSEDDSLFCMNNEEIFGPTFYSMSFGDAINRQILIDYKIIAVALNCQDVQKTFMDLKLSKESEKEFIKWANAYALDKFIKENGASHVVTYHSSVRKAQEFHDCYKKISKIPIYHVNGNQTANKRHETMKAFSKDHNAVITNSRCLTEGIDVPSIDAVFFCDPKNSKIDILQATGRALRRADHKGKQIGYVIVPIFHSPQGDVDEEIKKSSFSNLMTVVRAIATQDSAAYQKTPGSAVGLNDYEKEFSFSSDKFEIRDLSSDDRDFSVIRDALYLDIVGKFSDERGREFLLLKNKVRRLKIKSLHGYKDAKKKGLLPGAPWSPDAYFKGSGWIDWGDFLGTGRKGKKNFLSFADARAFVFSEGIKSRQGYGLYVTNENSTNGNCQLPSTPHKTYKDSWVNWEYFLGKEDSVKKSVVRLPFDECKAFLRPLQIGGKKPYQKLKFEKKLPINIPWKPEVIYKDEWSGWADYLGRDE